MARNTAGGFEMPNLHRNRGRCKGIAAQSEVSTASIEISPQLCHSELTTAVTFIWSQGRHPGSSFF
ncbi:hypothetical protein AAFF_G00045230 [Aldrovandia affinis]|uniref:Uncharacterized protein n=1 Tax=Aldrovandia affinis TaxID=143900 RepID=A0AAD7WF47_9TELE|nr:hypothetical protein AAFF_G00045230 [Aldrovandia affinis]